MEVFYEVLKYTIPALIVFMTVYFLIRNYTDSQLKMKTMEMRKKNSDQTLPLKMQAYERLAVFCDRISIPNLIARLRTNNMTTSELRNTMMIVVKQEFDHNVAQQIYISDKLWEIISLAKDQTLSLISESFNDISEGSNASVFADKILDLSGRLKLVPSEHAKAAIHQEVAILL